MEGEEGEEEEEREGEWERVEWRRGGRERWEVWVDPGEVGGGVSGERVRERERESRRVGRGAARAGHEVEAGGEGRGERFRAVLLSKFQTLKQQHRLVSDACRAIGPLRYSAEQLVRRASLCTSDAGAHDTLHAHTCAYRLLHIHVR